MAVFPTVGKGVSVQFKKSGGMDGWTFEFDLETKQVFRTIFNDF